MDNSGISCMSWQCPYYIWRCLCPSRFRHWFYDGVRFISHLRRFESQWELLGCRLSDIAILRWAYKRSREIMRRLPVYRGAVPQSHPQFPEGSNAITTTETSPVDISAPKFIYTAEDDAAIDDHHRHTGTYLRFWVGGCFINLHY